MVDRCPTCGQDVARPSFDANVAWLQVLGDALVKVMKSGSDAGWDDAVDNWETARRG